MNHPVHTQWINLPTAGGGIDAYLALPPGGRGPGLLLLQEIFGVNEHIRAVAEQYALAGFVVLAPDVFGADDRGHCEIISETIDDSLGDKARIGEANCPEGAITVSPA